ncbi:MAG: hypothetical protein WCP57_03450 [Bacteroidota bacterium]
MLNKIIVVICLSISLSCFAQQNKIKDIASQPNKFVSTYQVDTRVYSSIMLPMSYGNCNMQNTSELRKINPNLIKRIDLVYTAFPISDFNELTEKRIQSLYTNFPNLFSNSQIEWNLVAQSNCQDIEGAKLLYHGFVIYYIDINKKPANFSDINYIKERFKDPNNTDFSKFVFKDSSVLKTLSRNADWSKILVVADLTGSMSPYVAQLLMWYRLNTKKDKIIHWVFFNDGDFKTEDQKKIGSTGGIYDTKSDSFEDVLNLSLETMMNGNGGDAAENDVEALLKGLKLCPECEDIVLIADNNSPIRDIDLAKEITKPIKIILCGSSLGVNTQFLDLAIQTKGSIHTIEEDLQNLVDLSEGQILKIGKQTFKVVNGKIVAIKGM